MNIPAIAIAAIVATLVMVAPRRWALVPLIAVAPLLGPGPGQAILIGSFTFYVLRLVLVILWLRILVRAEFTSFRYCRLDVLILLQFSLGAAAYVIARGGDALALVNRLGWAFDGLTVYFAVRILVRDAETWGRIVTFFAISCIVIAPGMLLEHFDGRNRFAILGSVDAFSEMRDGSIRSQGPFLHPILAGAFAANLTPLFLSLPYLKRRAQILRFAALASVGIMVATSFSSTPFLACAATIAATLAWPLRAHMRAVRWAMLAGLGLLQVAMNAPIWAILAKGKVFGGSTGWYRYNLLDNFIRRFSEWWAFGVTTTQHWGRGMWDVTIMYVRMGVDGGLATFLLFIAIIAYSYREIGLTVKRSSREADAKAAWAIGAALTGHVVAFFGVNYWDQNILVWYTVLGVAAGSGQIFRSQRRTRPSRAAVSTGFRTGMPPRPIGSTVGANCY